jgi:hypothetical protein
LKRFLTPFRPSFSTFSSSLFVSPVEKFPDTFSSPHLEVIAELQDGKRRSLEEQVLELLAQGAVLTRAKVRECMAVQNERLGLALESLERAGRLCRTPAGWQRLN